MLAGIRFNQLGYGDPLADKNWSYNNLWGIYAVQEKLKDQFKSANDLGFKIIYDSICPIFDSSGNLTLKNSGINGDIWPVEDSVLLNRINIYEEQVKEYDFTFICEIKWPEPINNSSDPNKNNIQKYYDFFMKLLTNPNFNWIKYWQIDDTPEDLIYGTNIPKVLPTDYVTFLNKIRTSAKLISSSINIGGPGIYKCLGLLDSTNYLYSDTSFYHKWLTDAINDGLLYNIDFFSCQLRQNTNGLEHDKISLLTQSLNVLITNFLTKHNIDTKIPIYSISQGRREIEKEDLDKLKTQAYYNVSDMLTSSKNGVIPIVNCIIDECDNLLLNPTYDSEKDGYGILRYDMSAKPQYDTFKFILNNLNKYTTLTTPNKIYSVNANITNISFINNDKDVIISVIWSEKISETQTISLLQNTDEYYLTINGSKTKIINSVDWSTTTDFIIIIQNLNLSIVDTEEIENNVFKHFMYNINFRNSILKSIPSGYNKDSEEMNFNKILRAFIHEFTDAQIQVDILRDNNYLETAHDTAIYQNFGTLVDLEKQSNWDYEQYRRFIQGVMKSLLTGATVNSVTDAINLFVNYDSIYNSGTKIADIKIHELFDDKTLDPTVYDGVYPQFAFVVEVNKSIDIDVDQDTLNRDLKYIVNILKPAHTLSFIIIILSGTEDYKDWYYNTHLGKDGLNVNFKDSDEYNMEYSENKKEGIYGWKHKNYVGQFHTYDPNKIRYSKLNGGIYIGPRYTINNIVYEDIILEYIHEQGHNLAGEYYDIPLEYNSDIIRYGYYHDNNDSINEQQHDDPVPLLNRKGQPNPDYGNPDSGEYYKNWWLKYHKIQNDTINKNITNTKENGKNIIQNRNLLIKLETDTTKFNTDVILENKIYPSAIIEYKSLPLMFTTNNTLTPKDIFLNEISDIPYDIKYNTAPTGGQSTSVIVNNLPPELKIYDKDVPINKSTNELYYGDLPYNNINQRPYRPNELLYGKDFYFEDMDQSPNFQCESEEKKFGENIFKFALNTNILPTSLPSQPNDLVKPIAYGLGTRDHDISMEMYKIIGGVKVEVIPLTSTI